MDDYRICYHDVVELENIGAAEYDIFISSFNLSQRVTELFDNVTAKEKYRLVFSRYEIGESQLPNDSCNVVNTDKNDIINFFHSFFESVTIDDNTKICVDLTGFIRPYFVTFIKFLYKLCNIHKIDFLYSEPQRYSEKGDTQFSSLASKVVNIDGCASENVPLDDGHDILILSSGYDDKLVDNIVSNKKNCSRRYCIVGFPSLTPDMYHESIYRLHNVDWGGNEPEIKFAPADNPFVTAQVIKEIVKKEWKANLSQSIYLSPLSSKPHVLGFLLFYLWEGEKYNVSMIYPYSENYKNNTSTGIGKIHKYSALLPS
jgi:hypothetical protein